MSRRLISLAIFTIVILVSGAVARLRAQTTPLQSAFFATATEESYSTYQVSGDGDLWPNCWASDGNLYTANGDGKNFSGSFYSMAIGKIAGSPPNLTGSFVAGDVGQNYAGSPYTDKPTGMLCANGAIYLAYQNLNENTFSDAPAANIIVSTNNGATWSANPSVPMFGTPGNSSSPTAYKFTTIFFLDFGQNSSNAIDGYVYAYGLDNNWRDQTAMYLARVPSNSILNRSAWQFFSGMSGSTPQWTSDITLKAPVLTDQRHLYRTMYTNDSGLRCPADQVVVAQGGVVYDKPLNRYLFTSWGCSTHELYEAPQPWGPWSHVLSKDFGPLLQNQNSGEYGTSIPSKFISADGRSLYLQSNVCCGGGAPYYTFSLRKVQLVPSTNGLANNSPSNTYNIATAPGTAAVSKSTHFGTLCAAGCSDQMNSGNMSNSEDDWDAENKVADAVSSYWGYTWPQQYSFNKVVYTTGGVFPDGGWFSSNLTVQVRKNEAWTDVSGVSVSPAYPYSNAAGAQTSYTFSLPDELADGVRIIGVPGGSSTFTSITQLAVYYGTSDSNMTLDPGFELQQTNSVSSPWNMEGPDTHGIDRGLGFSHGGSNNAWIRNSSSSWNSILQPIAVSPNTSYVATVWVQNNFGSNLGYFGVRDAGGHNVYAERSFSAAPGYTQITVPFNSGSNSQVSLYCGFWGTGADQWLRMDDFALERQ